MPFDSLTPSLKIVAERALTHCRQQFGGAGLRTEEEIAPAISWRPTFHLRPHRFRTLAVEVADNLYPEALKGAAHDIRHYNQLITVFQVCSLEAVQADKNHKKVNELRRHGFGLLAVAEDGSVTTIHPAVPLIQHITQDEFDELIKALPSGLKVLFRSAFSTYQTTPRQGVQEAAQIVEGLIASIARQGVSDGTLKVSVLKKPAADTVDALWDETKYRDHRAALGGARHFLQAHRNPSSHTPKSAKDAAKIIRDYRAGFMASLHEAVVLARAIEALGYKVKVYAA